MLSSHRFSLLSFLSVITLVCSSSLSDEAEQTIESSIRFLYLVYDEIHERELQTTKDPVLNDKYKKCGVMFTAAANALIESIDFLKSGDYRELPPLASLALQQIQNCDNIFSPPATETKFKTLCDQAVDVCTNVLNVVKRLASGKT